MRPLLYSSGRISFNVVIVLSHHHHISCFGCGKIVAITEEAEVEKLIDNLAKRHGFTSPNHQLEISGYCPVCQKQTDGAGIKKKNAVDTVQ